MEALEARIGRLLVAVTYVSVGFILIGVLLMIAQGISPLDAAPPFDLRAIPSEMLALKATGFLWAGLVLVLATPISRVVVAAWAYARRGDRLMLAISVGILLVIAVGVVTALAAEG